MSGEVKLGLALGAGLSRGLAHIGVIKVLLRHGLEIGWVAGTSMGSLIGALFCCGLSLSLIEKLAQRIQRRNWVDLTIPRMGLIAGDRLEELVFLLTRRRNIEELPVPFAAVAADLQRGERIVFRKGPVARAVRASCAIPGMFNPVIQEERLLVDGGVLERVPVEVVKSMGAVVTVAVDVTSHLERYRVHNIYDVISKTIDIMSKEITRYRIRSADIIITPDMQSISPSDFSRVEEAISKGEEAAEKVLPKIKEIMQERREKLEQS